MITREQKSLKNYSTIKKEHNRSFSENANLKNTLFIQQRLKKQIKNKFSYKQTADQANKSTVSAHRKSKPSILMNNPLTKSLFSMNDTITHKAGLRQVTQQFKKVKETFSSHKKINASYRQRYSNSMDDDIFRTRIQLIQNRLSPIAKPSQSAKEPVKNPVSTVQTAREHLTARNNKFKLLFREKNTKYKSASERKLSRIDSKLQILRTKNKLLESLMPKQRPKVEEQRQKPRGQIVKKEKIMVMALNLIKYLQLYFNMYNHNNIVGGQLKKIQGYNNKLKTILMLDLNRAKRITAVEEITNHFWVYKEINFRPQFFGEEDLALYNALNGFLLKMEKKYSDIVVNYSYFEQKKKSEQTQAFRKTFQNYQKKSGPHEQISKINKFMQTRLRHQQDIRQDYMNNLQKRGVKLNLIQRSRQLILREKERAAKVSIKRPAIS